MKNGTENEYTLDEIISDWEQDLGTINYTQQGFSPVGILKAEGYLKAEKFKTLLINQDILGIETFEGDSYLIEFSQKYNLEYIEWKGLPTLSDRGDVMTGFKMIYNFKTEKGRVIKGRTNYESGHYFGESMKKVGGDVINISYGKFTTCDKEDDPHFHFRSRRIKVIP
ncbi:MAG: hypothetical protein ACFFFH_19925, partial [Candidatus Thorarchaeota archaeon]